MPRRFADPRRRAPRSLPTYPDAMPETRARCEPGSMPRPCPFVRCRHHLLDFAQEPRRGAEPIGADEAVEAIERASDTCALDVADRQRTRMIESGAEPMPHALVGEKMGASRETVKKIEEGAFAALAGLRNFLAASPIADESGDRAAAPDLLSLPTDTGYAPLGFV